MTVLGHTKLENQQILISIRERKAVFLLNLFFPNQFGVSCRKKDEFNG